MQKPWGFHPVHTETESLRRRQTVEEVGPTGGVPQRGWKEAAASPSVSLHPPHPTPLFPQPSWKMSFQPLFQILASPNSTGYRAPDGHLTGCWAVPSTPLLMKLTPHKSITAPRAKVGCQPGPLMFWLYKKFLYRSQSVLLFKANRNESLLSERILPSTQT